MSDRDILFQAFQEFQKDREKRNFNALMDGLEGGLVNDLNKRWAAGDNDGYQRLLSNIKGKDIRVFRNSEGKHKLKFI
mgnify:CR=1 FL=1